MPLVTMKSLLKHAVENKYAVGYFEAWNMESILAVIDAAEEADSPVIIGFGGSFIGNADRWIPESIFHYGALGKAIAEGARVPAALILNESDSLELLIKGLKAGFNAVMYQDPEASWEEVIDINRYLVKTAHYFGADVEAEVGELPTSDISTDTLKGGEKTDPGKAAYFVQQTGIDALAIAAGNVHLLEGKKSSLDLKLIKSLRERTDIPLVLHGGTGISEDDLREAVSLGICKVNVGTVLKRVFIKEVRGYFEKTDVDMTDPHDIVGKGGALDMLSSARNAVKEEVLKYIKVLGSEKMARCVKC